MLVLDTSKNDTSATLDLLRAGAAQMVCVGHAFTFFKWDWRPTGWPLPQNVGVLLFFVLSGFLITMTLVERSRDPAYGFGQFCIDRFARIYSGLVPALLLVALIDNLVFRYLGADPSYARDNDVWTFIANLAMLEIYRGILPPLRWPVFGSASPLWTLAIEWHIYIFVAALFFIWKRTAPWLILLPVALFFGQTPLRFLFGAVQADGVGLGLFSLWLGGAAIYFLTSRTIEPNRAGFILAIGCAGIFTAVTHTASEYNFGSYAFLVAGFLGLMLATQTVHFFSPPVTRIIRFFADYSFTLYLVHYTVMYALRRVWPESGTAGFFTGLLLANATAIALAYLGEKHHKKLARLLNETAAMIIARPLPSASKPRANQS
jgi:peptidoglycan/LPS O-acetylase OafA/YrhL